MLLPFGPLAPATVKSLIHHEWDWNGQGFCIKCGASKLTLMNGENTTPCPGRWPPTDAPLRYEPMQPALTIAQRLRLIEIAHETNDASVREEALAMLKAARMMIAVEAT